MALILVTDNGQFGLGFSKHWEALTGSTNDAKNPSGVAATCYAAALVYVAFIVFCACQVIYIRWRRFDLTNDCHRPWFIRDIPAVCSYRCEEERLYFWMTFYALDCLGIRVLVRAGGPPAVIWQ